MATVHISPGTAIQPVVNANPAGTVYCLTGGAHRHQMITPKNNDQFYGEYGAILSGAKVLTGWIQDGARWYVSGQTQGSGNGAGGVCRAGQSRCNYPEDVFFTNVRKQHVATLGAVGAGKWFFDYAADRIYVGDNPSGHTVETSVTSNAFIGSATGVRLVNLFIEKYANRRLTDAEGGQNGAIKGGANWIIEDCEVRYNHSLGIQVASGRQIRRCRIVYNGLHGISGNGNTVVVEDNEIAYNLTAGYDDFWEGGGTKFAFCNGLTVARNWVHHNDGPGLWTDIDNYNVIYEDNIVEDNQRGGIFHEISFNVIIRRNTIRRNGLRHDYPGWVTGAGIEITTSQDCEVYENVLTDNWQGITVIDDHRGGSWTSRRNHVYNNDVTLTSHPGTGGGRTGVHDTSGTGALTDDNTFENNRYVLPNNGQKYFFWSSGSVVDKTDAEWLALGHETGGSITRV